MPMFKFNKNEMKIKNNHLQPATIKLAVRILLCIYTDWPVGDSVCNESGRLINVNFVQTRANND